jgi:hypothetical protein
MKHFLHLMIVLVATAALRAAPSPSPAPEANAPSSADAQTRSAVLELAGAFSNDGYKIRDGYYFGDLTPGKGALLEVNLFAGNEYWFCAAANAPARKIVVKVYNEDGVPVEQQAYEDGSTAAAGVVATESGKYLVKITLADGEKSPFSFVYCYK